MSATAFLRQRRAVAAKVVQDAYKRSPKEVAKIMAATGLTPDELGQLHKSNTVLKLADDVKRIEYDEPDLDSLEELNTDTTGDRAAVHSPDVREDQFEDKLQQPCQETVGVGNMHDGPQAAEDLANVGGAVLALTGVDGDIAKGAAVEAALRGDALARGTSGRAGIHAPARDLSTEKGVKQAIKDGKAILAEEAKALPERVPSSEPAEDEQVAPAANETGATDEPVTDAGLAESAAASAAGEPTDPEGTQEGRADTPVDRGAEAEEAQSQADERAKFVETGLAALDKMDRDQLVAFATEADLDIGTVKEADKPAGLRKRIRDAVVAKEAPANG
jgi:hypothetical protein